MTQRLRAEGNQKFRTSATTGAGTSALTKSGVAGTKTIVTHISGSGDVAGLVTLESPSGTVLWQKRWAAAYTFSENFAFGEIEGADGADVVLRTSAATAASERNIAGVVVSSG